MRKNAVNRELYPVAGGICAPKGFKAGGIACGIKEDGGRDLALILADRRCPVACVYTACGRQGNPITLTKKHVQSGYGRAIIANGGTANVFLPDGERLAREVCSLVSKYCNVLREEVAIASTGYVGKPLFLAPFERGIKRLSELLDADEGGGLAVAEALNNPHSQAVQLSFSFDLGDYRCKIGVIYKTSLCVSPDMATTLVFLTTDVNITPEMLQKALRTETKSTLNALRMGGGVSPNDMVCIMANGSVGNSLIDCVDSEYQKFTFALGETLKRVCRAITSRSPLTEKGIYCKITGVHSNQAARALAKRLVECKSVQRMLSSRADEAPDLESIFYALAEKDVVGFDSVRVYIQSEKGTFVLFEGGKRVPYAKESVAPLLDTGEAGLCVELEEGNYSAVAYGCVWK